MLNITAIPKQSAFRVLDMVLSPDPYWKWQPVLSVAFGPYSVRPPAPVLMSGQTIDGYIESSGVAMFGDKPCEHLQVEGNVMLPPAQWISGEVASPKQLPRTCVRIPTTKTVVTVNLFVSGDLEWSEFSPDGFVRVDYRVAYDGFTLTIGACRSSARGVHWGIMSHRYSRDFTTVAVGTLSCADSRESFLKFDFKDLVYSVPVSARRAYEFLDAFQAAALPPLHPGTSGHPAHNFLPLQALDQVDPYVFGDLAQSCAESMRFTDVNSLSFVKELREVSSLIPKIGSLKNPKTWANAYLCLRYGIKLTAADIKAYCDSFARLKAEVPLWYNQSVTHASKRYGIQLRGIGGTAEHHYKIVYYATPDDAMEIIRFLDSSGFYPTLTRDWDMIPLSFVLDWGVNVSSLLERLDARMMLQYYTVLSVVRSTKIVFTVPVETLVPGTPYRGMVTQTYYKRHVGNTLDLPTPRFDAPQEFHNWVDLTALIVALR